MIKRLLSLAWLLAIVVGAWQLARYSGVPAFLLPSPAAVGQALLQQHVLLIHHASYTLGEIALALLLLLPPVQKHLTLKLMPHLRVWRGPGAGPDSGFTVDGEYERKDSDRIGHDDRHDR